MRQKLKTESLSSHGLYLSGSAGPALGEVLHKNLYIDRERGLCRILGIQFYVLPVV